MATDHRDGRQELEYAKRLQGERERLMPAQRTSPDGDRSIARNASGPMRLRSNDSRLKTSSAPDATMQFATTCGMSS